MNTKQILRDLSRMCCEKKRNFDVLPADFLPTTRIDKKNRPFYLVANTAASFEGDGEHWVCMYIPKKYSENIEYFDSFGLPAINNYFEKFISNNCKKYVYNANQLQADNSTVCGNFCVVFLNERCTKKKSLSEFVNHFSKTDREMNDAKIRKMYNKLHAQHKVTRVKNKNKKMTQRGRGLYCKLICNQTCITRQQMHQKMRKQNEK